MHPTLFKFIRPLWQLYDRLIQKRSDHWAFATHHLHTGRFIENQRALFEHVKADPNIRKLIFFRGTPEDFQIEGAVNYEIIQHGTLHGLLQLARCKVVFLTHSISMDFSLRWGAKGFAILPLAMRSRVVVNLWHGIPLKRLLYAANEETRRHTDRVPYRRRERLHYAGLIASSDVDSYAMAAMFYPLNYQQIWCTGLPRNDFLTCPTLRLPRYIRDSLTRIQELQGGKRLVVYAPTYRQTDVSTQAHYYQFSDAEIKELKDVLRQNNAVLGYRPHYFKNSTSYFNLDRYIDGELIVDVSQSVVPEFSALARACDLLVTDYSSVYIETLYLGKPAICFAYDLEHYQNQQDGLLYELSLAFPGPVCREFSAVLGAIAQQLQASSTAGDEASSAPHAVARKLFFKHCDDGNSQRVYEQVRRALTPT
jgi:CDP-glycerol glycerophosphotransferase (TagB/SpsB family)